MNPLDVSPNKTKLTANRAYTLEEQYAPSTPPSHQCGFIAQSVKTDDQLQHAEVGGEY